MEPGLLLPLGVRGSGPRSPDAPSGGRVDRVSGEDRARDLQPVRQSEEDGGRGHRARHAGDQVLDLVRGPRQVSFRRLCPRDARLLQAPFPKAGEGVLLVSTESRAPWLRLPVDLSPPDPAEAGHRQRRPPQGRRHPLQQPHRPRGPVRPGRDRGGPLRPRRKIGGSEGPRVAQNMAALSQPQL